ncbi:Protein NRT1/ PTR FAMILY 5.7 [Glycine max]|nr:Protein NRT1/ PTR FAMILY 5.7 [Glycine max]
MEKNKIDANPEEVNNEMKRVRDSSLDHKRRVPLRASTGLESFYLHYRERLSFSGIASSLVLYLTKVIHQDLKTAVKNANYVAGFTTLTALLGGFLADAYAVHYLSRVLKTCFVWGKKTGFGYALHMSSWFLPGLKPCDHNNICTETRKIHEVSFVADQFDDNHAEERKQKISFFNWWSCGLCSGLILGSTVTVYVQDHVNWGVSDIILKLVMAISLLIFLIGRSTYRYLTPIGSPLTPMLQVLVAAISKRASISFQSNSIIFGSHPDTQVSSKTNGYIEKGQFKDENILGSFNMWHMLRR